MSRFLPQRALLLAIVLILAPYSARAAAKVPPPLSCREIAGIDPLLRKGQILLLGEMHGTNEIPAFVADAACRGLRAGLPVTVALEIPTEEEPRVAAFLASDGQAADRAALLAGPFWRDAFQDGRRSRGMLALLEDLRHRRREGSRLRVKLLDRRPKASGPERDRAMAGELQSAVEAAPGDLFLVLTGNLHTRRVRGTPWDPQAENMGYLVARRHPDLLSLDVVYSGGAIWACLDPDPAHCGVQPVHGKSQGKPRSVKLYDKVSPEGFNGSYDVGVLTASAPATSLN
jgi:hypothetical protein